MVHLVWEQQGNWQSVSTEARGGEKAGVPVADSPTVPHGPTCLRKILSRATWSDFCMVSNSLAMIGPLNGDGSIQGDKR